MFNPIMCWPPESKPLGQIGAQGIVNGRQIGDHAVTAELEMLNNNRMWVFVIHYKEHKLVQLKVL